jgi:propanol-preferring alcohol dehydrogenase
MMKAYVFSVWEQNAALAEAGRIHPHIEKFSLDQVDEVYRKLENHEIKGRAVLIP